jgi:hypothetical protein
MEHVLCDVTLGANVTENETAVIINRTADMLIGSVLLYANAVVAAGGGECDAYVQTKVGGDWIDVANFHFTTQSAAKFYNLSTRTVVTSIGTATASPIADNTCVDSFIGDMLRVRLITSSTAYSGASTLKVVAVVR